ncbi:2-hydroxyacid dehydrogenase [Saccharospirillum mangrovi]|uniref:2-hydroxyacid dehydrogenase n=1 Tax=Saccharospirillum mangrovi TaxID=2161747 RepID=UPI000D354243|nr:glyoxylate/hydroxypyruvate reductase A [Saccharospirillum mangrovi]
MSVLVLMSGSESRLDRIQNDFSAQGFNEPIWTLNDAFNPAAVELILAWKPEALDWSTFNKPLVQSFGAGVDHLLSAGLPTDWPVARFMSQSLKDRMARYVCAQLNNWQLDMPRLVRAQQAHDWAWHDGVYGERVLILGMGELGQVVASALLAQGYQVEGWSRSGRSVDGVRALTGEAGLNEGLARCDYLINLLPLTQATRHFLNAERLQRCATQPVVINVGRGGSLVDADLLAAIDAGQIGGAILDVFNTEPLPAGHPFWSHPQVRVTPHIASTSEPSEVIALAIENLNRHRAGKAPLFPVDLSREY